MDDLRARAIKFLQKRYPKAVVCNQSVNLMDNTSESVAKLVHLMIALDPDAAIKQTMIATSNLGSLGEQFALVPCAVPHIDTLKSDMWVQFDNTLRKTGQAVSTDRMIDSPKTIIYTDVLHCRFEEAVSALESTGTLIELIHEADMLSSVFISYGGPDETIATAVNKYLVSSSVKTWFFPVDALPGQKLHRVMSDGVSNHDRVLLICSQASLSRSGVMNELERVLEREAREGGAEILIPLTIDDFVFSDWKPTRSDIADQIRSRVIATVPNSIGSKEFSDAMNKVLATLKK